MPDVSYLSSGFYHPAVLSDIFPRHLSLHELAFLLRGNGEYRWRVSITPYGNILCIGSVP
jgi:hypothetical protein